MVLCVKIQIQKHCFLITICSFFTFLLTFSPIYIVFRDTTLYFNNVATLKKVLWLPIGRKICNRFVLKQLKLGERKLHVHIKLKMLTFEICHLGADKNNLAKKSL